LTFPVLVRLGCAACAGLQPPSWTDGFAVLSGAAVEISIRVQRVQHLEAGASPSWCNRRYHADDDSQGHEDHELPERKCEAEQTVR
jgi:hypothetical protein